MKRILYVLAIVTVLAGLTVIGHADNKTTSPTTAMTQTTTASAMSATTAAMPAAADENAVPVRVLGSPNAPVTIEEYVSFTCPHCAEYYTTIFPQIKEHYVDTGKVRIILHDFPTDAAGLKAGSLARCMPEEQFYPFVAVLFKNQMTWATAANPDLVLMQYAKLGGLPEDKAKACLSDTKMQDALVAAREAAIKTYNINATPEFVFNHGVEKLEGVKSANEMGAAIDKLLAAKP